MEEKDPESSYSNKSAIRIVDFPSNLFSSVYILHTCAKSERNI